jgi:hypothetical protein
VLVDRDTDDCHDLKQRLQLIARRAGLRTTGDAGPAQVLNRIAIEELEAWFLGDVEALRVAFPRVPASLSKRAEFRDPDAVRGGTAERLERLLQDHGYMPGGLQKNQLAREVAAHMNPDRNRSGSFRAFREGLRSVTAA